MNDNNNDTTATAKRETTTTVTATAAAEKANVVMAEIHSSGVKSVCRSVCALYSYLKFK